MTLDPYLGTLDDLCEPAAFVARHIGPDGDETRRMLAAIGVPSAAALLDAVVPSSIRTSLLGMGWYDTVTPPVLRRNVLENPGWYTAYTPYQPEISQGRLEVLLMFQTMVSELTGMDIANASMLDESTAAAEAMTLLHRANGSVGDRFVVDADTHPQTIAVVATRAEPLGLIVDVRDLAEALPSDTFGVLVSYPGSSGAVRDLVPIIDAAHDAGALVCVATDLLACCLLIARSTRRRVGRQRRPTGPSTRTPDPRAAHPS